jgi:hypothetical protein
VARGRYGRRHAGAFCDDGAVSETVEFRPRLSRALAISVVVLAAAAALVTVVQQPETGLRHLPAFALGAVAVWAFFGRPAVIVSDGGVELRNVLRTVELPWPSIQRIDTKYALTLYTAFGVYAAWAAPAPSRTHVLKATQEDTRHLPQTSYIGGGLRPGDLVGTASGDAAAHIRRRLEDLRDAGHLDAPRLERDKPRVRWHLLPAIVTAALAAVAVLALRLP